MGELIVVELETHAVVDFIVPEGDVILVDGVPLLNSDFVGASAGLGRHQLLEVADRVVAVALDAHLLPQPVVQNHLYHLLSLSSSSSNHNNSRRNFKIETR